MPNRTCPSVSTLAFASLLGYTLMTAACERNADYAQAFAGASQEQQDINNMVYSLCPNDDQKSRTFIESTNVADIHEYNDCQKLVHGGSYAGPLVGIFASDKLDSYTKPDDFVGGRYVALIQNFKEDNYRPLGIGKGTSCLVLFYTVGTSLWQAAIVHQRQALCPDVISATPDTDLDVSVQPGITGATIPPVARWDWEEQGRRNYIGVKCGSDWCEIGSKGFQKREAKKHSGGSYWVKGHYDEQYLAMPSGIRKSGVMGSIIPIAETFDPLELKDGSPHAVATVEISTATNDVGTVSHYVHKLALTPAADGKSATGTLYLQYVDDKWHAYMNEINSAHDLNAEFHKHPMGTIATTRWRWDDADEALWTYCVDGCCEARGRS